MESERDFSAAQIPLKVSCGQKSSGPIRTAPRTNTGFRAWLTAVTDARFLHLFRQSIYSRLAGYKDVAMPSVHGTLLRALAQPKSKKQIVRSTIRRGLYSELLKAKTKILVYHKFCC